MTSRIFVDLHDGRTSHEDEIMFWDESQNQFHTIPKIPGLSHQDHEFSSSIFQSFPVEFDFNFGDLMSSCLRS
jgi:hypothetical protein